MSRLKDLYKNEIMDAMPADEETAGGEAAAAELQQIVRYGFQLRVHGGSPPGIHAPRLPP